MIKPLFRIASVIAIALACTSCEAIPMLVNLAPSQLTTVNSNDPPKWIIKPSE